jgi:uncharacterized protein (TIGR03545 family)
MAQTKKKGPLRTEAIVTILIIFAIVALYAKFFFDSHLRKTIEWTASYIHGAEVNLGHVRSNFFGGALALGGLQVTDKEQPDLNLVAIKEVRFGFLWDALLRMKFVVDEAVVEQVTLGSKRSHRGWVKPPSPEQAGPSVMDQMERRVLTQVEDQYSKNMLGDLAKLAGGMDDKELLSQIRDQLQAEKKIAEIKSLIKEKEAAWKERIQKLPNKEEFDALGKSAKTLKFDTKDPKGFAEDLKKLNALVKDADQKIDSLKDASKSAGQDISTLSSEVSNIDELIKKDLKDLEARLKIPKIDAASFSKTLFARFIGDKLVAYQKYIALAKQYMPPTKTAEEKAAAAAEAANEKIVPQARGQGKNYEFPKERGYPLFWAKKVAVSSPNLEGAVLDITTNQNLIGKATTASLKGSFPEQQISGFTFSGVFDHRKSIPTQSVQARVESYPVTNFKLQDSNDAKVSLAQALGELSLSGQFAGPNLDVELRNTFTQPKFELEAKDKIVKEVLTSVISSLGPVKLDSTIKGTWTSFNMDIDSNLGHEISHGFSVFLKQKTDALRAKLKAAVDEKIGGQKKELTAQLDGVKKEITEPIAGRTQELEKLKGDLKKSSSGQGGSKDRLKDELKEKGKDLLKKLKL